MTKIIILLSLVETYKIILAIAGPLFLILLAILGFFLKRFIKSVDRLSEIVSELVTTFQILRKHSVSMDSRLNDHGKRITSIERDFAIHLKDTDAHGKNK